MAKPGPKRKYDSPDKLRAAVEAYIARCEELGIFPDEAGMRLDLDISAQTLDKYCKDEETGSEYRDILDWAKDKRESFLVRKMTSDNKAAQGCLNALKQPSNGGYIDRPSNDSGEKKLTINLVGVGGESAFK